MSDWRDDPEDEWAERPAPGEGVRIVGPDAGATRRPADRPARPPSRFPLPGENPGWSEDDATHAAPRPGDSGSNRLPHWTDPPTGEVPRIPGGDSADDDFESWSSLTGPNRQRFRTDSSDWNRGDFQAGELDHDDSTMIGALHDDEYEQAWGPPPRGRRGRGRGTRPRPEPGGPRGPGGLEGPPSGEHGEVPREDSSADIGQRVITGVVMAIIALGAFAAGRPIAAVLVTIVIGVGAFELYDALRRAGYHTAVAIGLLGCVAMVPAAYNIGERAFPLISALVITFTLLWYLFEVVHARPTVNAGLTLLVFAYVGILGGFAGVFLADSHGGTGLLGGVIICAIGSDVVAYFAGRSFGQTPLMPKISPNKTLEGLIAGAMAAVVLGGIVGGVLHPWADKGVGGGIALGFVVAVTAPIGDLVESMIKRDLRIKDLGGVLPGHGGFLDRFDAMLFALPAAYYLALYLFFH